MIGEETEKILRQVHEEILDKGYDEIPADFTSCIKKHAGILSGKGSYEPEECDFLLFCQTKMWNNKIEQPRKTGNPVLDCIMRFVKKVIGFIINPWVDSQNEFNANIVSINQQFYDQIMQMEKRINDLEKKIQELENK